MQTGIVQPSGPSSHFCTSAGSVCARYTASGAAAKRRVTTTWVSPSVFSVNLLMIYLSLLRIHVGEDLIEPAVIGLQSPAQHPEPLIDFGDGRWRQPARPLRAVDAADNEARAFEHLEVARDRGLGHLERLDQFHDGCFTEREASEDRPARGIG